jgi:hypothetical protein
VLGDPDGSLPENSVSRIAILTYAFKPYSQLDHTRLHETIDSVSASDVPSFDELLQLISGLLEKVSCELMQLVLVSKASGIAQFVQVADNPSLRSKLRQALLSSAIPLGVLTWKYGEEGLSASKFIFPLVAEDEVAAHVFDLICQEATEKVEDEFQRRIN